jgi:hypothetical protein
MTIITKTHSSQTEIFNPVLRHFPYGFLPTNSVRLFCDLLALSWFASLFSSPPSVSLWHGGRFAASCASPQAFPRYVTTPLPWFALFSCESFHFSFIRLLLRAISAAQSLPEWPGTTLAGPPLPPSGTTNATEPNVVLHSHDVKFDGMTLTVAFPLLSIIETPDFNPEGKTNHLKPSRLEVVYSDEYESIFTNTASTNTYTNFFLLGAGKPNEQPKVPWEILRTYGTLIAGTASNQFSVVLKYTPEKAATNWFLDVKSPTIITNIPSNGVLVQQPDGVFALNATNANSKVTFIFGPLSADQAIDFNLLDAKENVVTNLNHQLVNPPNSSQTGAQNSKSN